MVCHDLCGSRLEARSGFMDDPLQSPSPSTARFTGSRWRSLCPPADRDDPVGERKRNTTSHPIESACQVSEDLDQLEVDDSDMEDGQCVRRTTCGALEAVRTLLCRHIFPGAGSRRRSRASVGNSEVEIARRAELKRLMHKRIQDELENDDKDNTISSRVVGTSTVSNVLDLTQPGVGPRDNIEFAVSASAIEPASPEYLSSPQLLQESSASCQKDSQQSPARPSGGPQLLHTSNSTSTMVPCRKYRSTSPCQFIASSPLSKVTEVTCCSSVAPGTRLAGDADTSDYRRSQSLDGQSALGVWLASQHLVSQEALENEHPLAKIVTEKDKPSCNEFPGQDTKRETTKESPVQLEGVVTLSSQSTSITGQNMDANGPGNGPSVHRTPQRSSSETSDDIFFTPSELQEDYQLAMAYTSHVDSSSSNYPSVLPSFQPSPVRSRSQLPRLSIQDLKDLPLSPFRGTHDNSPVLQVGGFRGDSASTPGVSSHANYIQSKPAQPDSLLDVVSLSGSETTTFRDREAELRTIEQRFKDILARKRPSSPLDSRFREEFDVPRSQGGLRSAVLARVLLSTSKRSSSGSHINDGVPSQLFPRFWHRLPGDAIDTATFTSQSREAGGISNLHLEPATLSNKQPEERFQENNPTKGLTDPRLPKLSLPDPSNPNITALKQGEVLSFTKSSPPPIHKIPHSGRQRTLRFPEPPYEHHQNSPSLDEMSDSERASASREVPQHWKKALWQSTFAHLSGTPALWSRISPRSPLTRSKTATNLDTNVDTVTQQYSPNLLTSMSQPAGLPIASTEKHRPTSSGNSRAKTSYPFGAVPRRSSSAAKRRSEVSMPFAGAGSYVMNNVDHNIRRPQAAIKR
ncbi:hypothetical protein HJFPF1_06622 [Paramyrothecium foliicola]|nr:hypothetical protein HJFPF1_06622 [Paramyrothecium foliicola]